MYIRRTAGGGSTGIRLPPNYGGSAFYNTSDIPAEDPDTAAIKKEPQAPDTSSDLSADKPALARNNESEKTGLFHKLSNSSGGIGLEELLILGLALLISQNDAGDDLALLLLLLVFIK